MEIFDDIAALAAGVHEKIPLEDAVQKYERDGVTRVIGLWRRFAPNLPAPFAEEQKENPFESTPPQENWIKAYLTWRTRTAQSRLDDRIARSTLLKELQQILRIVNISTGHVYPSTSKIDMKSHIEVLVKRKLVSSKARAKPVVLYADSEEILTYLWCCDEYTYVHPRIMVQLTFYILVTSFWGVRPGEIVESSVHRDSNEGIKYQDIKLSLCRHERTGSLIYQIILTLRLRKFRRSDESAQDQIILKEETDPERFFACPVRWFLSLALADKAFVDYNDPADFDNRWIREGTNSREIRIAEDKRTLPILRRLVGTTISADKIMTAASIGNYMKQLGERCGYVEPVTCYGFRRGFANGVEGKVSAGRFRKAISHKNDHIFQSYVSSVIGIDTQNVVRNLPEDSAHLDLTRSIAYTRDLKHPKPHGSTLERCDLRPTDDIISQVRAKFPKNKNSDVMRKARRLQFLKNKKAHLNNETPVPDAERVTDIMKDARVQAKSSLLFRQMLKYNTHQASIIDHLWTSRTISISISVKALLPLAKPEEYCVWYPYPVSPPNSDMTCPYCGLALERLRRRDARLHVLDCHGIVHNSSWCFKCAQFVGKESKSQGKEQSKATVHACEADSGVSCGVVFWRDLLIRPGRCWFCNDNKLWTETGKLNAHIHSHLKVLQGASFSCPHQLCHEIYSTIDDLRHHCVSTHGIGMQRSPKRASSVASGSVENSE